MSENTIPEVYIIESLHQDDVPENRVVGRIIFQVLKMGGMNPEYKYVNTFQELQEAVIDFTCKNFRYLHLSFHGTDTEFLTHFDNLPFTQFPPIIRNSLDGKRVFVSACNAVNHQNHGLANIFLRDTGCASLVGSYEDINFNDATLMWSTFYYLCFRDQTGPVKIKREDILGNLCLLTKLFRVNLNYYSASKKEGISLTQINMGKKKKL